MRLQGKKGNNFNMCGPDELVDDGEGLECVAAIPEQDFCIARECCRVARYGDDFRCIGVDEVFGLRFGACARWVEDDAIECREFGLFQRFLEQIAFFRGEFWVFECIDRGGVAVDRVDCCTQSEQMACESAGAAEEVGDVFCALRVLFDQCGEGVFACVAGLQEGGGW